MNHTEKMKQLLERTTQLSALVGNEDFFKEQSYREIQESLNATQEKLKNRKYTVAVIAAMKAGKSTVFNSLLGADILPNETAACTAAITEIKYSNKKMDRVLKYYKDGKKEEIKAGGGRTLEESFHQDVRLSRQKDGVALIDKYYFEYPIAALNNEQYKELVENFILIDTPGPNEADTGEFDTNALKETTYYQLRNADAIILVFDYQVYKSDVNARLLREIFAGREDIKKDNNKIFFVVNKIDTRNSKDGSKEEIIENVKKMIVHQTEGTISNPQVLPLSALMALYGRQILEENISEKSLQDCKEKYQGKFSKRIEFEGEEYFKPLSEKELAFKLIENSDVAQLEDEVILNTFKKASSKMIDGAIHNLTLKTNLIQKNIQSSIDIQSKGIEELRIGIEASKKEVSELRTLADAIIQETDQKITIFNQSIRNNIASISSDLAKEMDQKLASYQNIYKSEDRSYLNHLSSQIIRDCHSAVSNYTLRKKDEIIRNFNEFKYDLTQDLYGHFRILSQRADTIIKKNLDVDIKTEGFMPFETEEMNASDIHISSSNFGSSQSDDDFKEQTKNGIVHASKGAAVGYAVGGPVGAVVGAIGGFILGIGSYEGETVVQQRTTYTLDVTDIKAKLRTFYIEKANEMQTQYGEYVERNIHIVNQSIQGNIDHFIAAVNEYLDSLETEFNETKGEREAYIAYLRQLDEKVRCITAQITQ